MRSRASRDLPGSGSGRAGLLGIDTVWITVAVALPAIASFAGRIGLIDLAYHLRAGEAMLQRAGVVQTDTFSFVSAGQPWLDQQWGAQVILAGVFRIAGFEGLQFLRSATMAATLALMFLTCRERGTDTRTAALLTLAGGALLLPALAIRPQMFGLVMLATAMWLIASRTAHPARLALFPFISIAWANTHGSFVLLPVVIGLAIIDDLFARRSIIPLIVVGLAATAATLLNPYGPEVWRYALDILGDPLIREMVTEWAPPDVGSLLGGVFYGSLLLAAAYLARRSEPAPWPVLLWLLAFLLPAFAAIRAIAWWGVVLPATLAGLVRARIEPDARRGSPTVHGAFLVALALAAVILSPWNQRPQLLHFPFRISQAVAAATPPGTRLFVPQTWGSWFEFALPDRPVFVDSRIELYPASAWRDYTAVVAGRADWAGILDRWEVDVLVTQPGWGVVPFVERDQAWSLVFRTENGLVFVRR